MIIAGLPEVSLRSTLAAVFSIPQDNKIIGFQTGLNLVPFSVVCGMPKTLQKRILTLVTEEAQNDDSPEDEDDGLHRGRILDHAMENLTGGVTTGSLKFQTNAATDGGMESEVDEKDVPPGFVIKVRGATGLTRLLESHKDNLVVLSIIKRKKKDAETFAIKSTMSALSKRFPTSSMVEEKSSRYPYAPKLVIERASESEEEDEEVPPVFEDGKPSFKYDAISPRRINEPSPNYISPRASGGRITQIFPSLSESKQGETDPTPTQAVIATAPPLDGEEKLKILASAIHDLKGEGLLSKSQSDTLQQLLSMEGGDIPDLQSSIESLLLVTQDLINSKKNASDQEKLDAEMEFAAPKGSISRFDDGDVYNNVLGHVDDKGANLTNKELANLAETLAGLLKTLKSQGKVSEDEAVMLRRRLKGKDPIVLGTILNHIENGDTTQTMDILLKVIGLHEVADEFKNGTKNTEVRIAILRRFAKMRAISKGELELLEMLVSQKENTVDGIFTKYDEHRNPAWLLERLVEVVGSDDEETSEVSPISETDTKGKKGEKGGLRTLLDALSMRPDVTQEEIRGIIYLVTKDPSSSLLAQVQKKGSNAETVSLLIQAYRQMEEDEEDEEDEMYEKQREQGYLASPSAPQPDTDPDAERVAEEWDEFDETVQDLKRLILRTSLESERISHDGLSKLYVLAESRNRDLWAAYTKYRETWDWKTFKTALERIRDTHITLSPSPSGEHVSEGASPLEIKQFQMEHQTTGPTMDVISERNRSVGALVVQQGNCEKEMKILELFGTEGYLEDAETEYLANMVREREPVIMAAFDVLRETEDWREMYDTMCRLLRREAANQLVTKYQDIYQNAVFCLLTKGEIDPSGALTLIKLLEERNKKVVNWLGHLDTFHGFKGGVDRAPNLLPLVRRVAQMSLRRQPNIQSALGSL
ncbi:hypothetical protein AAMO2058_000024700 [Amorphochlora amoebiformis]